MSTWHGKKDENWAKAEVSWVKSNRALWSRLKWHGHQWRRLHAVVRLRRGRLDVISVALSLWPLRVERQPYAATDTWFPALRCRSRIRFRNRFCKNRVRTWRSVCRCWGVCAAVARQAQEASRRFSRAKVGGAPGVLATYGTAGTEK